VSIHFANPLALALLALAVPVLIWARRSIAGLGKLRAVLALALRLSIVALLALSLAQPQWSFRQDDMTVIYVVDQSLSVPPAARAEALDYVRVSQEARRPKDKVGLVVFGKSAALEQRAESRDLLKIPESEEISSPQSLISPQRTNVAEALRLALAALPSSSRKRIVLVSDGNENIGLAAEEAEVARRNEVRIDVKPITYAYTNEIMVEKVVTPASTEKGATFEVRTVINAAHDQNALLRIYENGSLIGSQNVELKGGRNVFFVERKLPEPGYYSYTASIETPTDTLYANNQATGFTIVHGESRVLVIESNPADAESLTEALRSQGINAKVVGLEALPLSIGELVPYDTIILSNVSAGSLGKEGMRSIELAVKNWGVGLVMIGGENSFGPGGYQDSAIETALPVSMDIKQKRIMPSGALVVILHTCEIAQGNYWAQQIALAALDVLSSSDEFGVMYYGYQAGDTWLFNPPLQRAKDKQAMRALIRGVQPGDMGSFIAGFQMAHKELNKSTAAVKHVVVISDGDPAYPSDQTVLAMVADGITISTVGINPHTGMETSRLSHVAAMGNGRYYEPTSASVLPKIFIKEAATVRRALIFEEPFQPAVSLASETIKGILPSEYPTLEGYVVTEPKKTSEIPLVTHHKDPLLAHWQYGLGRTVAFTSDAKARWASQWIGWGKFDQFWTQVVRWATRSVSDAGLHARSEIVDDKGHIIIDALDKEGKFINGLEFTGTLVTPDAREAPLAVEQIGPGRYETTYDASEPGTHYLSLNYTDAQGRQRLYTEGIVVPYSSEYRELRANTEALEQIAKTTKGRVLGREDDVFARTFDPEPRYEHIWPWLLAIAAVLAPADVFVRRVFVDYAAAWRKTVSAVRSISVARRRARTAPTHVDTLLGAKKRTRDDIRKRTHKFEADEEAPALEEPTLGEEAKPKIEPLARRAVAAERPGVQRDDETYMGRLLKAKRAAREEEENKDAGEPGS